MQLVLTQSASLAWKPLVEPGIQTAGQYVKVLRMDDTGTRPVTFMIKFDAGASYPNHNHPAGEEVFVLEGSVRFGGLDLSAGDFLYTPPGGTHAVHSKTGCVMLFNVPEEVEIL